MPSSCTSSSIQFRESTASTPRPTLCWNRARMCTWQADAGVGPRPKPNTGDRHSSFAMNAAAGVSCTADVDSGTAFFNVLDLALFIDHKCGAVRHTSVCDQHAVV